MPLPVVAGQPPEGRSHPAVDPEDRWPLLQRYCAALVKQLLTPAPDGASVKWKQMALASGKHRYTDLKSERIERAFADDLAFLAAHPVRQSNRRRMKRRRRSVRKRNRQRLAAHA